ncbi:MAG: hypothetical protein CSA05_02145 [Bacteroidia bacterium]|nr:MAG: hypothetical protein CSA05_02145 [Bacteroidia bacterium]
MLIKKVVMKTYKYQNVFVKQLFFILLFIFVKKLSAQEVDYDLSKYKIPDYKRHYLNFNLDVNGNKGKVSEPRNTLKNESIKKSYYNSIFYVNYNRLVQTRKFFGRQYLYTSFNFNHGKTEGSETLNKDHHAGFSIETGMNHRHYKGLFFAGYKAYLHFSQNKGDLKHSKVNDFLNENTIKEKTYITSGALNFGYGRIEKVSDARHAVYILDELRKNNCIAKNISEEDVENLATTITKLKTQRFLDSRLRKIKEISTIDSVLRDKGFVKKSDAAYFTTLYDFWDYGGLNLRTSGYCLKFEFTPMYNFNKKEVEEYKEILVNGTINKSKENSDTIVKTLGYTALLSFEYNKPLNLYFQLDYGAWAGINTIDRFYSKVYIKGSYFPNTRTSVSASSGFVYFDKAEDFLFNDYDFKGADIFLSLDCNYYFSPALRLSATYNFNHRDYDIDENYHKDTYIYQKESKHVFKIKLIYSLF